MEDLSRLPGHENHKNQTKNLEWTYKMIPLHIQSIRLTIINAILRMLIFITCKFYCKYLHSKLTINRL